MKINELIAERELRVHGNGFIQLDVTPSRRLHFWGHPSIPRQKVACPIHDHVFGFHSRVIKGEIVNVTFLDDVIGFDYEVHGVVYKEGEGTILEPRTIRDSRVPELCGLRVVSVEHVSKFNSYGVRAGEIHDAFAYVPTITSLDKLDAEFIGASTGARVFIPFGTHPDNEFQRDDFDQNFVKSLAFEIAGEAGDIAVGEVG